jgi:putative peptidoglycan lipid II flippase
MTAIAIVALGAGVPAIALTRTLLPAFYSRQDTRPPVRAGVAALVVNMVFNFVLIAALFEAWAPPDLNSVPWLDGIARLPGLHLGLAIASSVSNYLQFALLWHYLKRAGVYTRQPGWTRHWLRLGIASAAMMALLAVGVWLWPDWTTVRIVTRGWHLAVLVVVAACAYVAVLFGTGFRMRDLHAV